MASQAEIDMRNDDTQVKILWANSQITSLPERFKYILKYYSQSSNFEDTITEWAIIEIGQHVSTFCICSKHDILTRFFVWNKHNHNVLRIGSECIKKFMSQDLKDDADIILKQFEYSVSGGGDHKFCPSCKKHTVPLDFGPLCRKCFNDGKSAPQMLFYNGRKCDTCHRMTIPVDAESYYTSCLKCYREKQKVLATLERNCEGCGQIMLPGNRRGLARSCDDCRGDFRECIDCHKKVIANTEPAWKVRCLACYRKR